MGQKKMELNMSDTSISNFVVSYGGKDANIDIIYRNGQKFYNATKLWQNFSGKEPERVYEFLRLDDTKKFLFQKHSELTVCTENVNIISHLTNSAVGRVSIPQDIGAYLTKTHKQSLPNEILEPFVYTKRGVGGGTYLSEDLFIDYAMKLSAQIKSVVIEVFRKYGWLELIPQEKKADALLDMTLQEEMKTISEQFPTRNNENIRPTIQMVDENAKTKNITSDEDADLAQARLLADNTVKNFARVQGKLTTKLMQELVFQIIKNEKKVFERKEDEQKYFKEYYSTLFDTMYLGLFNHRAQKMREMIEQDTGTPRDSLTSTCLLAVQRAEATIASELHGLIRAKRILTISDLKTLVIQCCEQPAADLFKYSNEIDFLIADKKIPKTNQVKQIDVTLDDNYKTQIKTNVVELPKKEKVKKITNNTPKTLALQPGLFDDTEF
jgi:hypothetical protein